MIRMEYLSTGHNHMTLKWNESEPQKKTQSYSFYVYQERIWSDL